jgi:molecular chaperone GrpE
MRIKVTNEDSEQEEQPLVDRVKDTPEETGSAKRDEDRPGQVLRELADVQDKYLRALADLDNYRKRYDRELARNLEQERERLIKELLPVADSLDRAVSTENASTSPWFEGLLAVRRQVDTFLRGYGVEKINVTKGEHFSPAWHEAVAALAIPDTPQGIILDVAEPGYKIGGKVLRPARVIVAGGQG